MRTAPAELAHGADAFRNSSHRLARRPGDDMTSGTAGPNRSPSGTTLMASIELQIEWAVQRAVENALKPYLRRICDPEPATYTTAQAATVLGVGPETITRLVRKGALARVPHVEGKLLVTRASVDRLLSGDADISAAPPASRP